MRRALAVLGILVLSVLCVVLVRSFRLASRQPARAAAADPFAVDAAAVGERLAGAVRFRTISERSGEDPHPEAFARFETYLEESYPLVHAKLTRERVAAHSLLYTWTGRDTGAPPLLLAAHQDVVPIDPGTEPAWQHAPFAGDVVDGVVWGRGALDDKGSLIAILEAVESLLAEGYTPERGVLLAFGHDEEVGGAHGALEIAKTLGNRGVRLASVVDEGGVVAEDLLDLLEGPVAVVGIAEKGSVSLRLTVDAEGGHSSTPPRHSAVGILAAAVARLEESPFPASIDGTTRRFLESLAPELPFPARAAIANLWLTGPLLESVFSRIAPLNAMIRTTTAATIFHAGVKENVLPKHAEAVVNFRILPGESVESVIAHVRRTVADERVEIATSNATAPRSPSGISPDDAPGFRALARAIRAVHGDAIVVPYLVVGGTDARHYAGLTDEVYRFGGFRLGMQALHLVHGTDERVSLANLANAVRFYRALIREQG